VIGGRPQCRADKLTVGMTVSLGCSFGPIAEIRRTDQRIGVRVEGDSLWFTWQHNEQIYLEPAEHVYALQAERRR
jgi:hypothetical protein